MGDPHIVSRVVIYRANRHNVITASLAPGHSRPCEKIFGAIDLLVSFCNLRNL